MLTPGDDGDDEGDNDGDDDCCRLWRRQATCLRVASLDIKIEPGVCHNLAPLNCTLLINRINMERVVHDFWHTSVL